MCQKWSKETLLCQTYHLVSWKSMIWVSRTVLNFLFGPQNYQQHHNTIISKFYKTKNAESFVVSLIEGWDGVEGWDTAEQSTMRKFPYHDSSFSLEVPLLFQTKNIGDWIKQNESEVEKYDIWVLAFSIRELFRL